MALNKQITQLNTTTYKTTPKDDPKDRIEVEVGDIKQPDFLPAVKDNAVHPLSWLIRKFMPVPNWTDELINKLDGKRNRTNKIIQ